jgi:hypothetical protein
LVYWGVEGVRGGRSHVCQVCALKGCAGEAVVVSKLSGDVMSKSARYVYMNLKWYAWNKNRFYIHAGAFRRGAAACQQHSRGAAACCSRSKQQLALALAMPLTIEAEACFRGVRNRCREGMRISF